MNKVSLGDVVKRVKDKVDKEKTDLKYYIGGEHFEYAEVTLSKRGAIEGSTIGPAFHMRFKPGNVLLMSRNPHLRKAGVVNFEGICSDVSYVCETKDELVLKQRFLPFLFQTDDFWSFAEANKKGSTNFFLNWSDFERYEFNLPSIEEQERLSELLWAANDTKDAYKKLLSLTDGLVKSQFIEMFGDPATNPMGWPIHPFNDFASIEGGLTTDYEKYADYPHIGIDSIEKDTGKLIGYRTVKEDNVISGKYIFTSNHIIYSKIRPVLNKVALPDFEGLCSADAYPILPNPSNCNRVFLATAMRSSFFIDYILQFCARSHMPKANRQQLSGFIMPLPPITLQNQFAEFAEKADKSKFELQQAVTSLENTIKSLMLQHVG